MNNMSFYAPYDSLGRRIGFANNFAKFTDTQLSAMKTELGLFMQLKQLKLLQDHCKNSNQNAVRLEELYLLDEIFKASLTHSQNAFIYNFLTDSEEIATAFQDFLQKHKAASGEDAPIMNIEDAAKVYPLYSHSIGLTPIAERNTEEKQKFNDDTAFLYLYSEPNDENYDKNAYEFISSEDFSNVAYLAKRIDNRGIAYTLATLCDGIYADLHSIPGINETPELSHLATEAHDRYIVAVTKENIGKLSLLAERFSLKCVYFARAFSNGKFTLRKIGRTQMSLDTSVILSFGSSKVGTSFYLNKEEYIKCQNELTDALLPSVALGAALDDITVSVKYEFPKLCESDIARGNSLSAVLGAYRAEVELCVAASEPIINYTNTDHPEYEFSSYCDKSPKLKLSDVQTEAYIYLLSYNKNENGTPDYYSLRAMCKTVKALVESESTLLALPIVSSLSDATKDLLQFLNIGIRKNLPFSINDKLSGILVLSTAEVKNGLFVGMVAPAKPAKQEDAESTSDEI